MADYLSQQDYKVEQPTFWERHNPFRSEADKRKTALYEIQKQKEFAEDIERVYNQGLTDAELTQKNLEESKTRQEALIDKYIEATKPPEFDPQKQIDLYGQKAALDTQTYGNQAAINTEQTIKINQAAHEQAKDVMGMGQQYAVDLRGIDHENTIALRGIDHQNAVDLASAQADNTIRINQQAYQHEADMATKNLDFQANMRKIEDLSNRRRMTMDMLAGTTPSIRGIAALTP